MTVSLVKILRNLFKKFDKATMPFFKESLKEYLSGSLQRYKKIDGTVHMFRIDIL